MRKLWHLSLTLMFLLALAFLFKTPVLIGIAKLLTVNEACRASDAIFVLAGDAYHRVPKAIELFQEGYAPQVLLNYEEEPVLKLLLKELGFQPVKQIELSRALLRKKGVPNEKIVIINRNAVKSTFDEAIELKKFVEQKKLKTITVVTSSYHAARARWIINRVINNKSVHICLVSAPHTDFNETNWWHSEQGFLTYFQEYLKWVYYLLQY